MASDFFKIIKNSYKPLKINDLQKPFFLHFSPLYIQGKNIPPFISNFNPIFRHEIASQAARFPRRKNPRIYQTFFFLSNFNFNLILLVFRTAKKG